jgi:arylsulfatase A-like enzyme
MNVLSRRSLCVAAAVSFVACHAPGPTPGPLRLVDLYKPQASAAGSPLASGPAPIEWRFAAAESGGPAAAPATRPAGPASGAWSAGPGVQGLAVRDGRLVGRTTSALPVLALQRPPSDSRDVLHEVHVRMRASAGANVSVAARATEKVDLAAEADIVRIIPWPFNSPIVAGDEMRTYVIRTAASVPATARHVLIRPTDAAGATFEIESVRLVTRREYLAAVGTGLGWQGLSEMYRETLVARAPDRLPFDLRLAPRARLDLAIGTIEDSPVTFAVAVRDQGGHTDEAVFERTVTLPHRWETATVDLSRFGGRDVTLTLALASDVPRALGFWGTPVIRSPPASASASTERPQGVILIWADTLRRDHLPFYGYARPTAPVLSRLAAEGTVFEDCVAQASWTKASGPSILTGLYPTSHGVQSFNDLLPSSATTIAEAYRQAGYATLGLSSIQFVGKFTNLHQGFEELHEQGSFAERQAGSMKSARSAVDRLATWLAAHRRDPFFVLLHVADPHSPHQPNPPYDTMFADPAGREQHARELEAVRPLIANALMRRFGMPTRAELEKAGIDADRYIAYEKDWYDGSIRGMDAEIGRLGERLRELGLDRRTLVAFLSDHGEEFLEHGRTFHRQGVYGELANVPLMLWWPGGVPAGTRVPETVQLVDVMPTLLELSGLSPPPGLQGASLASLMRGGRGGWPRPAITEAAGRPDPSVATAEESFAVSLDGWKLVHHPVRPPERPEFELFHRRRDPLDSADVAAQHPEVVARLSRELQAWRRMAQGARLKSDADLARSVSGEELERLRALGYVQ